MSRVASDGGDDCRAHRIEHRALCHLGKSLVERKNCITVVPCALEPSDKLGTKRHVKTDKFAHKASVRAILER